MYQADLKHQSPTLQAKLQKLYTLGRGAKLDLGFRPQYLDLLAKFGNPHRVLPPTIHVAGTNGKGSTIAFMRAILEHAGYTLHSYTSPHLTRFNERIYLAGGPINDHNLEALIDEALSYHDNRELSFFEITTAIAFAAFARTPADILLLETGLGGRLDCTNVIEDPLLTIITPISLDHQEFLGNTLEKITTEKAGILKKETPCIVAEQSKTIIPDTLKAIAKNKNVQLQIIQNQPDPQTVHDPKQPDHKNQRNTFEAEYQNKLYQFKKPVLQGFYQIQNAKTSIAALNQIAPQFPATPDAIQAGLDNAQWPARMQDITNKVMAHIQGSPSEDHEIWLDGGHNESAALALAHQIKIWNADSQKPLHLIIGMMPHKDPQRFIEILEPYTQTLHRAKIQGETTEGENWQDILQKLFSEPQTANHKSRVLICGSLYLAGDILQTLGLRA